MCGIVGYVGPQQAQGIVIDGLRRMEYRGYDSAGIALVDGGTIASDKRAGKLANLEKAIEEGRFRAPLLHRLAGYEILIPPLRERKIDIPVLAEHFLARYWSEQQLGRHRRGRSCRGRRVAQWTSSLSE